MILVAAYHAFLRRLIGVADVVVPTFSPGRAAGRFDETVGSFFNFLPLRADLAGADTFREVIARVRACCVQAYVHDIPTILILAQAPDLMTPAMQDDHSPFVFQIFPFPFVLDGTLVGDLEWTEMRRRTISQPFASDVPDGGLWTLNMDPMGDVVGSVQYRNNLYEEATIAGFVDGYRDLLITALADIDAELA